MARGHELFLGAALAFTACGVGYVGPAIIPSPRGPTFGGAEVVVQPMDKTTCDYEGSYEEGAVFYIGIIGGLLFAGIYWGHLSRFARK